MTMGGFYGWWIAAASFLILFIAVGVGLYVPPVFLVPLQDHFGWSRAAIVTGSGIAALTSGVASPFVGLWIDKSGPRTVMISGALIMGFAFVLFSFMGSLWHLYAINVVAAIGLTCTAWIPNQTLVASWFDKKRGLAMGIALTGIGFGGLFMAPLAGLLVARLGWRLAFAGLSCLLLVVVAVLLAVVRSTPGELGLLPDGDPAGGESERSVPDTGVDDEMGVQGLDLSESVRTSAFWILSAAHFLWVFANLSVIAHLVAFLSDLGFASQTAAGTLGLTAGASVAGRLIFGGLADRFAKRRIMAGALLLHAVATLLLIGAQSVGALPAFVVIFGLALGGCAVLAPLLVAECFGLSSFGKTLGLVMISGALGAAIGPVLTGRIYDVTGSYQLAFIIHIGAFLAAALAICFLPRPLSTAVRSTSKSLRM